MNIFTADTGKGNQPTMKSKYVRAFMTCAETFADLSHAERLKVGCVIVKDNRIISIGYNGMPAGWENKCETLEFFNEQGLQQVQPFLKTKPEVLHAESNAIAKLARSSESGEGAVLFTTHAPCIDCAKLIYQSGISEVYYKNPYRDDKGVKFLLKSEISVKNSG